MYIRTVGYAHVCSIGFGDAEQSARAVLEQIFSPNRVELELLSPKSVCRS